MRSIRQEVLTAERDELLRNWMMEEEVKRASDLKNLKTRLILWSLERLTSWVPKQTIFWGWRLITPMLTVIVCPVLKPRSSLGVSSWADSSLSRFTDLKWSCTATFRSKESLRSANPMPTKTVWPLSLRSLITKYREESVTDSKSTPLGSEIGALA